MKTYYVYILSNPNRTLYIGITSNLPKRVWEHKEGFVEGFTKEYSVHKLVYFESTNDVHTALRREKCLKRWKRDWKIRLIESMNPEWKDLYPEIIL